MADDEIHESEEVIEEQEDQLSDNQPLEDEKEEDDEVWDESEEVEGEIGGEAEEELDEEMIEDLEEELEGEAVDFPDDKQDDFDEGVDHNEDSKSRVKRVRIAIRKPPSKWILFLTQHRKSVSDANPELPMGEVTKVVANMYKELPESELQLLETIIEEKKREYEAALSLNRSIDEEEGVYSESSNLISKGSGMPGRGKLLLPLARIKRIIKLDEEVKNVSKESVAAIAKSTELFIARLAVKAASSARLRGGRTINMNDLLHTIHSTRSFEFLDLDFPKPSSSETKSSVAKRSVNTTSRNSESHGESTSKRKSVETQQNNGKYSMLNFISGNKRLPEDIDEDDRSISAARIVTNDDDIEELDEIPISRYANDPVGVPSHLEW
jgi:histone H3/H4